jgi:hypothetical protein
MTDSTPRTETTWSAGWYPDPNAPGSERYFDGSAWTDQVRPAVSASDAISTPASNGAPSAPEKKSGNPLGFVALGSAVVGFIFACIPGALIVGWILLPIGFILGIVSVFLAKRAKWPGITAIVLSVVGTIVGIVVFFALAAGAVSDAFDETVTDGVGSSGQSEEEPVGAEEPVVDEEPAIDAAEELVLGATSFGMDDNGWGWYAVEVTNPNADYIFGMAGLEVEAYDAAGVLLDTDTNYGTILQGSSVYVGKFLSINSGVIDRIEVRGPTAEAATYSPAAETGSFTMGDITTGAEYDWMTVNGTVTSNFSEDQDMVRIDLVARDASGAIVGVDFTYTDRVPAGGTAAWDLSLWEVPLDSTVEAYPHL